MEAENTWEHLAESVNTGLLVPAQNSKVGDIELSYALGQVTKFESLFLTKKRAHKLL